MAGNGIEKTQQCVACNRAIFETANLCKCGHVNEAMRTIAGKRFSGYREELYTRRVIKESRDEYRRKKRESRGIKPRKRRPLQNRQAQKQESKLVSSILPEHHNNMQKLPRGLDSHEQIKPAPPCAIGPHSNRDNQHITTTCNLSSISDSTENSMVRDVTSKDHVMRDVTSQNSLMNSISPKKTRQNPQYGRRAVIGDHETGVLTTPLDQLAIAGPLEEINKKLRNQSTFWMCLV